MLEFALIALPVSPGFPTKALQERLMNLNHTSIRRMLVTAAAVAALGLATGCHKKQGPPPNSMGPATAPTVAAPTATISADPIAIDLGQSVVLNWRTQN